MPELMNVRQLLAPDMRVSLRLPTPAATPKQVPLTDSLDVLFPRILALSLSLRA